LIHFYKRAFTAKCDDANMTERGGICEETK